MKEIIILVVLVVLAVVGYFLMGRLEYVIKPRHKSKDNLDDHPPYSGN